jgi:hypothetical protein
MATYKVLQDIEAEDKLLGPLTLRQFIYALVCVFFLYLCFVILRAGLPLLLLVFFPPALFTGFFAFPFMKDQPTEVWALAKLRFLFKPRRRIWDQSGIKELVTITVPKRVEQVLTDGLTQSEVRSRLSALASTLDSRGWAIKNINVNMYNPMVMSGAASSDRLIDMSSLPQQVPSYDIMASDDILDENNNPVAQQFEQMINASSQAHRQQLVNQLNDVASAVKATPTQTADYWFLNQPATSQTFSQNPGLPQAQAATANEEALLEHIKESQDTTQVANAHLRTLQPLSEQQFNAEQPTAPVKAQASSPAPTDPAILSLANNNDLNVATLARQANKAKNSDEPPRGEVVISLR